MAPIIQSIVEGTDFDDLIDANWPGRGKPDAAEAILGRKGHDTIFGLGGNDSIDGGPGNDTIEGGAGNDTTAGGAGADRYIYNPGDGIDRLIEGKDAAGVTDSVLITGTLSDLSWDFDGNDLLIGPAAGDLGLIDPNNYIRVVGQYAPGSGGIEYYEADTLENAYYTDQSVLPGGIARIYTPSSTKGTDQGPYFELIRGTSGSDTLVGGGGYHDHLNAAGGNDLLLGSDDTVDEMYGGFGNDTLRGFGGNDQVRGQQGNDILDGGDGIDRLTFITSAEGATTEGVHVDLNLQGKAQFISASQGWDTLISIEEVRGSNFNDTLIGDDGANSFLGGGNFAANGDDQISGKGGDDTLAGGSGNDTMSGGSGADILDGDAGDDSLDGGPGEDTIIGGPGNDTTAGGTGSDQYIYNPGDGVDGVIEGKDAVGVTDSVLITGTLSDLSWDFDGNDLLIGAPLDEFGEIDPNNHIRIVGQYAPGNRGIEFFEADLGDENAFYTDQTVVPGGIARVYTPSGTKGTDQGGYFELIQGTAGNDTIVGGGGYRDQVGAGAGNDLVIGADVTLDRLFGGSGNDTLRGLGGDDRFRGQGGNDIIDGGDGNDRAEYGGFGDTGSLDAVHVDLRIQGTKQFISASQGWDTLISIEEARGSNFNDTLIGNDNGNFLVGGIGGPYPSGDDLMYGMGGDDGFDGMDGNDTIYGGTGADGASGGDGNDSISGEAGDDGLEGAVGNDSLLGGSGADFVSGGEGDDSIDGGSEDDWLVGDAGNDTMKGSSGADYLGGGEGDDWLDGGTGSDQLEGGEGNDLLDGGSENDWIAAFTGNDTITGGSGDDYMAGEDGKDSLNGGTGFDVLDGQEGNDNLSGGDGNDTLNGGTEDDALNGDAGDDNLEGGDGDDTMRGGAQQDQFTGGEGDDRLFGDAGEDTLDGGQGSDTIRGGAGSDIYVHGGDANMAGFDVVVQNDGNSTTVDSAYVGSGIYDLNWSREGNDLIISAARNENYDFNDTGYLRFKDHYGSGNAGLDYFEGDTAGDNSFYTDQTANPGGIARVYTSTGNSGQDQGGYTELLWGGAGNDKMQGNGGYRDYLYGDAGNDTLTGSDGTIDHLRGGTGNDRLLGMAGEDRLRPGEGNDLVNGGDGRDRVEYLEATGGVTVDLNIQGVAQSVGANQGKDTLISIEEVSGSQFADLMIGNASVNNFLIGEGGDDTMIGGADSDSILGGEGADVYRMTVVGTGFGGFFDFTAGEGGDVLDVSAIIDFGESGLPLSEYLLAEDTGNALQIFVDTDGGGDNFQMLVSLYGASGQSVESLLAQGNLIVDGTVAV